MPAEPCPSDPKSRLALTEFLLSAFHLKSDAPFVRPEMLRWKYDEPRIDYAGPRSHVWKDAAGQIVAHACLCPVTYSLPSGAVRASYLIDWAASRAAAGAGVSLLRTLAREFDVLLAVGGTPDTLSLLPKLGYRRAGELQLFARVIRPWDQFRTDPFPRGWKAPLRLARNMVWSRSEMPAPPAGWSAQPITTFDLSCQPLFAARVHAPFHSSRRTPGLMNYWLACPGAVISAALLRYNGELRGWYVLSRVLGQTRVADLWIDSNAVSDWAAGLSLASAAAVADPAAYELVAALSVPIAIEAAPLAGLRLHHSEPIFALDPKTCLGTSPTLNVTPLESDLAYHQSPTYPYLT